MRGSPSKLTDAELARYRTTVYGMAAAMGRVPRMSFGRDRYGMAAAAVQVREAFLTVRHTSDLIALETHS